MRAGGGVRGEAGGMTETSYVCRSKGLVSMHTCMCICMLTFESVVCVYLLVFVSMGVCASHSVRQLSLA